MGAPVTSIRLEDYGEFRMDTQDELDMTGCLRTRSPRFPQKRE